MSYNRYESYFSSSDDDDGNEDFGESPESVILFFDVDSFEVQVRGKEEGYSSGDLQNLPFVVVNEHNVITAVNYEAKKYDITRHKSFTLNQAKRRCPQLTVLKIPNHFGKPDSLLPRQASDEIYKSLEKSLEEQRIIRPIIEKNSKDEFFVDVSEEVDYRINILGKNVPDMHEILGMQQNKCLLETPRETVRGPTLFHRISQVLRNPRLLRERHDTEKYLVHGASIALNILETILDETGFMCSAGVSSNKLLAKLGCAYRKPGGLSIFPQYAFPRVSKRIDIPDCPGLGGQFGWNVCERFGIRTLSQLSKIDRGLLQELFGGENALKLHQLSIGYDSGKVVEKKFSKSLRCGITFNFRTRNMYRNPQEDFQQHLRGRFLEMRDHLLYEYKNFRDRRLPQFLRLEINTRKGNFRTIFSHKMQLPEYLRSSIMMEANSFTGGNYTETGTTGFVHPYWQMIYQDFLEKIRSECRIELFSYDRQIAAANIRKISAINLTAIFAAENTHADDGAMFAIGYVLAEN